MRLVLLLAVLVLVGCVAPSSGRYPDARAYFEMAPASRAFVVWSQTSPF